MLTNRFAILALAAIASLPLAPSAAGGICYDVETVNVRDAEGNELQTSWIGVNNSGVFVGDYCLYDTCDPYVVPGVIYDSRDGTFETFTVDGFPDIEWGGINDRGEVVFEAYAYDEYYNIVDAASFFRDPDGVITQLDFPGTGVYVDTQAINNAGTIAGFYYDLADGRYHGAIWEDGEYTVNDVPEADLPHTLPLDITNDGTLIGIAYNDDFSAYYSFVDDGRSITWIDYGEGSLTLVEGGNDRGQLVGNVYLDGLNTNFIYADGEFDSLDIEGALSSNSYAINNHGVIAGIWGDELSFYGYIAWPVSCRRR